MFSRIDVFPIKDHLKDVLKLHGLKTDQDILAYSIEELIKSKCNFKENLFCTF